MAFETFLYWLIGGLGLYVLIGFVSFWIFRSRRFNPVHHNDALIVIGAIAWPYAWWLFIRFGRD